MRDPRPLDVEATIEYLMAQTPVAQSGDKTKPIAFNLLFPNDVQTNDNEFCIRIAIRAAITITKLSITLDSSANEVFGDLKWADAFIGLANATVINAFDTTSGVLVDSSITAGSVAAGKCLYLSFDTTPDIAIKQMAVEIEFTYD